MGSPSLGYLSVEQIDDRFIGGIMITDHRSIPLEFRYTDPIQPTAIHRIIFGSVLKPYITNEVIKKTLLKDLRQIPDLLFVRDPDILESSGTDRTTLLCLQTTALPPLDQPGLLQRVKAKEILFQTMQHKNPLKLEFETSEPDKQENGLSMIRSVYNTMDLLEPFERLTKALQALCKQPS
jgi:hypothetical protein